MKSKMKKIMCFAFTVIFLFGIISANGVSTYAQLADVLGSVDKNWKYEETSSSILITEYIGSDSEITLPETIKGKPVTTICEGAFKDSPLTSIKLPNTIKKICDDAFYNCQNLISLDLPNNLELIGDRAFSFCTMLNNIEIPDTVTEVGNNVFTSCNSLKKLKMSSLVNFLGSGMFKDCVSLSSFEWDVDKKYIGSEAFEGCVSLGIFNFDDTEKLLSDSFRNSGVTIAVLGASKDDGNSNLKSISYGSFTDCDSLETVAIGGNVTTVNELSFADCDNLQTAIIADSVKSIAENAFDDCNKLTFYCTTGSYAYQYAQQNGIPVTTFQVDPIPNQTYTGTLIKPDFNVSVNGKELVKGFDYKVTYSDNLNVGTATAKITGLDKYKTFACNINFAIIARSIGEANITPIQDQVYTGGEVKPKVIISYKGKLLNEGK
ncbi:MAG: leucine-rich repeat domain-containing protein, partial [Clostridia bacterium]|nr:leucine-rich repeat domain-containing protein [Clostridia bacterium]